jgi:hypothetical protein
VSVITLKLMLMILAVVSFALAAYDATLPRGKLNFVA